MIEIKGKLGEWKKFDKTSPLGGLMDGEGQEVAYAITYQAKDGTQMALTFKHKDFIEPEEDEVEDE